MPDQKTRPVDVSYADFLQHMSDVIALANWDETDALHEWRGNDVAEVRDAVTTSRRYDPGDETTDAVEAAVHLLDRLEEREVPLEPRDRAEEIANENVYDRTEYGKRTHGVDVGYPWITTSYVLLLEGGGPTVVATIAMDECFNVRTEATFYEPSKLTYSHSWGADGQSEASVVSTEADVLAVVGTYLQLLRIGE